MFIQPCSQGLNNNQQNCAIWHLHDNVCFHLQCRKFKGSEAVRRQAALIYDKFKTVFHLPSDVVSNHGVIIVCIACSHSN